MGDAVGSQLVGHCYTKARKFPLVVGKLPGGGRLPGGPYSLHQLGAMVGAAVLMQQTAGLWARFGWFNIVIFAGVPYGLALVLRHARIDGRNPMLAALGWLSYLSAPRTGRLRGRPCRPARPRRLTGRFLATQIGPTSARGSRPAYERPLVAPTALDQLLTSTAALARSDSAAAREE